MHEDSLIVTMISDALEEDATTKKRDLERRDIDVGSIGVPCISADGIRHYSRKEAVKVEEEEQGS